jgi:hypothetical protein
MNLGQILETHWGWAARQLRCRFLAAPFRRIQLEHCADPEVRKAIDQILASTDNDEKALQQVLALAEEKTSPPVGTADDTKAKFKLVDPRTEEQLDHAVTVGWQYFMKLNHLAADKVHGREVGDVTRVTMQPVRGRRQGGGQRFGEMELWALLAHHVPALIEETLTLRSDDVIAAQSALSVAGQPTYAPALPESVRALALILRGLLLKLERRDKGGNWSDDWQYLDPNLRVEDVTAVRISPASAADVEKWCGKVAVQEVGDLKRGVEYFCPDHGWWRPEVTRHDLAMMTRQRRVPSHEDRKRERSGRQCPLCSDKPSLERPVWVFSPGGLCDTQAMGGAGDSFSLGATATLPEELKGRSKPAARFSRRDTMALMRLAAPVANPLLAMTACAGAPQSMLRQVLSWETVVDRKSGEWINWASRNREGQAPDYIGGLDLLKEALRNATVAHRLGVEWPDAVWNAAEIAALPIVPPDFRAIWFSDDGAKRPSELHVLYMDVLNANRALKHALESAPQDPKELLICKRRLQRVVNMLFIGGLDKRGDRHQAGSLGDLIQGKQGLLRYALLGKRVNYSGRAVIVGDPDLDLDECRLPRAIVKSAGRFLGRRAQGRNPQEATVLLNRAPSLHRSSVMAFKATEWDEDAIAVPPLVCGAFNADFDGDTMSVFVPLRDEALSEASNKMSPSRHALSAASGKLQLHLAQDIVSATFIASHSDSVARNSLESLLGSLGAGPLDKSGLADLITQIARDSGSKEAAKKAQELLKTVLPALTRWGLSLGIADIPYLAADRRPVRWGKEQIAEVESWCTGQLRSGLSNDNPVSIMVCSGARGDMRSVMQMGALRGTVQGSGDGELVVRGNFREGLSREDFLTSAYGARRTLMDKKLATADAGYLTRLLVECTYGQVVSARDCGTTKGLEVRSFGRLLHAGDPGVDAEAKAPSLASRLVGRVLASPIASLGLKKGQLLNEDLAGLVESAACSSEVVIRSPLTCEQQDGLCQHCYGWDLSTRDFPEIGMPLGVIAAQSVGERGTQLTMRTFHSGGIKTESITSGLPRVRRLLAGKVDMRQLVSADSKQRLEWDLRYAGEPTDLRVLRRKNGQPILKTVRLGRYREALEVLWHGFWWEMAQVYGAAVDARHFEVVLRSLLAGAKKPEDVAISASIRRGDAAHFVADAGFERAISVLAGAAFATDVKKNIGSIDELQRVKSRLMVGKR